RPPSFDPAQDAGARVEVHRLRRRLQKYYETEGTARKIRIVIPVGHYIPAFVPNLPAGVNVPVPVEEPPEPVQTVPFGLVDDIVARDPQAPRPSRIPQTLWIAAGVVVLVGMVLLMAQLARKNGRGAVGTVKEAAAATVPPPRRPTPVTAILPGNAVRLGCGH